MVQCPRVRQSSAPPTRPTWIATHPPRRQYYVLCRARMSPLRRTMILRKGIKVYFYVGGTIYEYSFSSLAIACTLSANIVAALKGYLASGFTTILYRPPSQSRRRWVSCVSSQFSSTLSCSTCCRNGGTTAGSGSVAQFPHHCVCILTATPLTSFSRIFPRFFFARPCPCPVRGP